MRDKRKIAFARTLRKEATEAEKKLWRSLRDRALSGVKFRRQYGMGPYIADFCCVEKKLVIELDGGGHSERAGADYDRKRTQFLREKGYRVLRFWDDEVLKDERAVLGVIFEALNNPHPCLSGRQAALSLKKGRGAAKSAELKLSFTLPSG